MGTVGIDYANWDLSLFFDKLGGEDYRNFRDDYKSGIAGLLERARALGSLTTDNASDWAALLVDDEKLTIRASHLGCYLYCLISDNAADEEANGEIANLEVMGAEHEKVGVYFLAAIKNASDEAFKALTNQEAMKGAEYSLRRSRIQAAKTMDASLEELTADLGVTGFNAWGRLRDIIAGKLEFDQEQPDGSVKKVPMAQKRSYMEHPDPFIRKSTLEGSNKAWAGMEDVAAACLNSIAGTRLALYKRRKIDHFLDQALFESSITRATLDAMLGAIAEKYEIPRRFLRIKAKMMGREKIGFQDEAAPLPLKNVDTVNWAAAVDRIKNSFGRVYPALAEFSTRAFDKNWIESEARPGKMPGGYCNSTYFGKHPVIFMTYNNTLGDVQTLAHELGHCFHEWIMRDTRPMARDYPMTLAESASTFAETILTDAILEDPEASDITKAQILDVRMQNASAFMLNIPMRFIFEKSFYEERAQGEVPVSRLKKLTLDAQRECYGDVLDESEMDPYFWASKGHFFITGVSFYNFPYSFGYLFSLGLFARFKKEGPDFLPQYERMLAMSASETAENVAKECLGVDLESKEFWLDSISLIEEDLRRFEDIAPGVVESAGA